MIPRAELDPSAPEPPQGGPVDQWLTWWQGVLGRTFAGVAHAAAGVAGAAGAHFSRVGRRPAGRARLTDLRGGFIAWSGWVALVAGAVAGAAIASPGIPRTSAALAGAASLLWAGARALVVRVFVPEALAGDPALVRGIVALGMLVYVAAVTPELRLLAWLVSGGVTAWLLMRFGARREETVRAVGFAWGAQALVVVGGWLAKGVLLGVLTTR